MSVIEIKIPCSKCGGSGYDTEFLKPTLVCQLCISQIRSDHTKYKELIRCRCQRGQPRRGFTFNTSCGMRYCLHKAVIVKYGKEEMEYCSEHCSKY